ncbi:MAG: ribbon-helix-helix protein, CopG family [Anaerolineae bacterium]|nr:ribbon-helix-helix protein, CopG family [Anaerolineae bacterium]
MSRTNRSFRSKITVQITDEMLADLDNVAVKGGKSRAEIVRQAIRNALDETDLTLGTRRSFDRRFQQRLDEMEKQILQRMRQFMGSTRDVFVKDVVEQSLKEIRGQLAMQHFRDNELLSFYATIIVLLCGRMLWESAPKRTRGEHPMDLVDLAIQAARGEQGEHIRDQIRDR